MRVLDNDNDNDNANLTLVSVVVRGAVWVVGITPKLDRRVRQFVVEGLAATNLAHSRQRVRVTVGFGVRVRVRLDVRAWWRLGA